ncbi:MAG: 50S ribosomal protein L44e [Hadesarchaea archaeon]|nr:50S ribosomal protein L44e [Hadesarchaea archaeon]
MKFPKEMRTHCPSCRKHTVHKVKKESKGQARSQSWGQRQYDRVVSGYGGQPRPKQESFAKTSKKATLVLKCTECGKKHVRVGPRTKRLSVE